MGISEIAFRPRALSDTYCLMILGLNFQHFYKRNARKRVRQGGPRLGAFSVEAMLDMAIRVFPTTLRGWAEIMARRRGAWWRCMRCDAPPLSVPEGLRGREQSRSRERPDDRHTLKAAVKAALRRRRLSVALRPSRKAESSH